MKEFNQRFIIENVIKRTGAFYMSDKTLDEINNGSVSEYGLKTIKIEPCYYSFNKWLESGYMITDCNISDHKKIICIK